MVETAATVEEYDFPDDLDEAERAYQDLVFEVQSIQEQLGNRNRTHPDGTRFAEAEYWEWRHRAAGAWRHQLDELRALKAHLKTLRRRRMDPSTASPFRTVDALVLAYRESRIADVGSYLAELAATWEVRS